MTNVHNHCEFNIIPFHFWKKISKQYTYILTHVKVDGLHIEYLLLIQFSTQKDLYENIFDWTTNQTH